MRRSQLLIGCFLALVLFLVLSVQQLWERDSPGAPATKGGRPRDVPVLVVTPRSGDKAEYGLKVLAGICVALSDHEGSTNGIDDGEPDVHAYVDEEKRPTPLPYLWRRLANSDSPRHVKVRWTADGRTYGIRFCLADETPLVEESRTQPRLTGCPECGPWKVILGPVTSEAVNRLRQALPRVDGVHPDTPIPILSPSATATFLTLARGGQRPPMESGSFYRFVSPDRYLAGRLAEELVVGRRARRIAVLYENGGPEQPAGKQATTLAGRMVTPYGEGLKDDFAQAIREGGHRAWFNGSPAPWTQTTVTSTPYMRGIARLIESSLPPPSGNPSQTQKEAAGKSGTRRENSRAGGLPAAGPVENSSTSVQDLGRKLADELVPVEWARRIAILYRKTKLEEQTSYTDRLRNAFVQAIEARGLQDSTAQEEYRLDPGTNTPGLDARAREACRQWLDQKVNAITIFGSEEEKKALAPELRRLLHPTPVRIIAVSQCEEASRDDKTRQEVSRLKEVFTQFRGSEIDAVGIFGTTEDKAALMKMVHQYLPNVLVFTTDADLKMEEIESGGSLLVASLLHPRQDSHARCLLKANELLHSHPVRPDVYMFQAFRATGFLLHIVQQMQDREVLAQTIFREHQPPSEDETRRLANIAGWVLSGLRTLGSCTDPTHRQIQFSSRGDLMGEWGEPQLLMLKKRVLTSIDLQRPESSYTILLLLHPLGQYAALFAVVIMIGLSRRFWSKRDLAYAEPETILPLACHSLLRRVLKWLPGPEWLRYHELAMGIFYVFLLIAFVEKRESITLLPNEFSVLPTVFVQCHLAALCLWYGALTRGRLLQRCKQVRNWRVTLQHTPGLACATPGMESPTKAFQHPYRRWITAAAILGPLAYEWTMGVPVTGWMTTMAFFVVTALNLAAYCFFGWFLVDSLQLASGLADTHGYPSHNDLALMHHHFRILVEPFVGLTFAAATVFTGIIISRMQFIDHWNWDLWIWLFFTGIGLLLLFLLYSTHDAWHDRMCDEKQRITMEQQLRQRPGKESDKSLAEMEKVPNWAWNSQLPLRVVGTLAVPLVLAVLQDYEWAADAWRSVARVLGIG